MAHYLVLQLQGPMSSWGEIAVGETRRTATAPSKSAIIGLVCGAMGIKRTEREWIARVSAGYLMACRVDGAPTTQHTGKAVGQKPERYSGFLSDFHTIQTLPESRVKRIESVTRRELLTRFPCDLKTVLSSRDYNCDVRYVVCLLDQKDPPFFLEELVEGLRYPAFAPYLGRRSCPLSMPMHPQIIEAETADGAMGSAVFPALDDDESSDNVDTGELELHWDEAMPMTASAQQTVIRRDMPIDRERWFFAERRECIATA